MAGARTVSAEDTFVKIACVEWIGFVFFRLRISRHAAQTAFLDAEVGGQGLKLTVLVGLACQAGEWMVGDLLTTMPSTAAVVQDEGIPRMPSISTMHIRQAP